MGVRQRFHSKRGCPEDTVYFLKKENIERNSTPMGPKQYPLRLTIKPRC